MRSIVVKGFGALAFALASSGCDSSATNGTFNGGTAELKVLHAAPAIGSVDVAVEDVSVIQGLSYGQSSGLTRVPSGTQRLRFRAGGNLVAQVDVSLSPDRINAVALSNDTAQATPVTPDTGQAATNRANIRLINIAGTSSAPPTLLSVLINAPGLGPDSIPKLGLDATVPSHGPLMYWDPGHFRFRFVPQGSTTVLIEVEFDVAAGEKRAVVLERNAAGVYSSKVVVEP